MGFQIDTFQADAFQTAISDIPYVVPMNKRYDGARVLAASTLLRYRALATGMIDFFNIWLGAANAGSAAIVFNLKVNGVAVWSGGDRPSVAVAGTTAAKTNIRQAVAVGDLIEVAIESLPVEGVPAPIDTIARVTVT